MKNQDAKNMVKQIITRYVIDLYNTYAQGNIPTIETPWDHLSEDEQVRWKCVLGGIICDELSV